MAHVRNSPSSGDRSSFEMRPYGYFFHSGISQPQWVILDGEITLLDGLALAAEHVSVPPAFPGHARALADASRDIELKLEGVVLKRLSSSCQPGQRSGDRLSWIRL